jgi:hypothetical protein
MRILTIFFLLLAFTAVSQTILIKGKVIEKGTGRSLAGALFGIPMLGKGTASDSGGRFEILVPRRSRYEISVQHLSYEPFFKIIGSNNTDTLQMLISLKVMDRLLDSVTVMSDPKPETLVGNPKFSIYDFDFYEDKILLLTASKDPVRAEIRLSDNDGKTLSLWNVPHNAGRAEHLFHDYEGYTDLICRDSIFRIDVLNDNLLVMPIPKTDFLRYIRPIVDTIRGDYYMNDAWEKYPSMNYYHFRKGDSVVKLLRNITDADLMKLYRLEYDYLPSGRQLEARRIARTYKTDEKIVGALLSGFAESMYYDPVYAPLFILNDTICIFDHCNDRLYHYSSSHQLIDSVPIAYHHIKNWQDWKKKILADEAGNSLYALFSHDGRKYLKEIDHRSGSVVRTFKPSHHSADRIRIREGWIYYVYRPFDSTQERFLYRERIR